MMIGMPDDQLHKIKSFILMNLSIKDPTDTHRCFLGLALKLKNSKISLVADVEYIRKKIQTMCIIRYGVLLSIMD